MPLISYRWSGRGSGRVSEMPPGSVGMYGPCLSWCEWIFGYPAFNWPVRINIEYIIEEQPFKMPRQPSWPPRSEIDCGVTTKSG
ncbi:hypothetical protein HZ326_19226 [Fusarium oxysporum f. sp. albedinis]|nr:hypothetical protein HZ326_19226 [Fusarium oxysporum f. sp. albedinis]